MCTGMIAGEGMQARASSQLDPPRVIVPLRLGMVHSLTSFRADRLFRRWPGRAPEARHGSWAEPRPAPGSLQVRST
jgi:hypothetical protein